MHATAWLATHLFFTILDHMLPEDKNYIYQILDVGSLDINGNMNESIEHSNFATNRNYNYTGVDHVPGFNVHITIENGEWPFKRGGEFDIVITSSCLEHDDFFWETMLSLMNSVKPGGFLFINVPSVGPRHAFPQDNWRFYNGSAYSFLKLATKYNQNMHLLHTSTLLYNRSDFVLNMGDTNMIFYKKHLEQFVIKDDVLLSVQSFDNVSELTLYQAAFHSFQYDLMIACNRYISIIRKYQNYQNFFPLQYHDLIALESRLQSTQPYPPYGPEYFEGLYASMNLLQRINDWFVWGQYHRNIFLFYDKLGYPEEHWNISDTQDVIKSMMVISQRNGASHNVPLLIPKSFKGDNQSIEELAKKCTFVFYRTDNKYIIEAFRVAIFYEVEQYG